MITFEICSYNFNLVCGRTGQLWVLFQILANILERIDEHPKPPAEKMVEIPLLDLKSRLKINTKKKSQLSTEVLE